MPIGALYSNLLNYPVGGGGVPLTPLSRFYRLNTQLSYIYLVMIINGFAKMEKLDSSLVATE